MKYIPCCGGGTASISVEGLSSAVEAPLCELGNDSAEGKVEYNGAASVEVGHTVKVEWSSVWLTCMHCQCRTGPLIVLHPAHFLKMAATIRKMVWETEPTFLAQ